MSREGGEICQVDLFVEAGPARGALECSPLNSCQSTAGRPRSLRFQHFGACPISHYLLFVWGQWQSNNLPFGEGSDRCEGRLQDPAGSVLQKGSVLRFPSHPPERMGSGEGIPRNSAHMVLRKHTELKGDRFWEGKAF